MTQGEWPQAQVVALSSLGMGSLAFLLGSIPFGFLIARAFRVKDLRTQGSGNIGATNVARVAGFWPAGFLTLTLDLLKGLIPVLLLKPSASALWVSVFGQDVFTDDPFFAWFVGLCAVLGHCFSPWLKFKGGKGVATGLGVFLGLSPLAAFIGMVAFLITFVLKKIGSIASISAILIMGVAQVVIYPLGMHLFLSAAILFLIIVRHEKNIDDLLHGRERSF